MRCDICGSEDAYLVCRKCGRTVCPKCFDFEKRMCVECSGRARGLGRLAIPVGLALLLTGFSLLMASSIMATGSQAGQGGAVVLFPFFVGVLSGPLALALMGVFLAVMVFMMLMPFLMTPEKLFTMVERPVRLEEAGVLKSSTSSARERDYVITVEAPGVREGDVNVQVFERFVHVRAVKPDGSVFTKTYELPEGYVAEDVEYRCEGDFIVIRVRLRSE